MTDTPSNTPHVPATAPRASRVGRTVLRVSAIALVVLVALGVANRATLRRIWFVATLFSERDHVEDFRSLDTVFPVRQIRRAGPVFTFERNPGSLPETFASDGKTRSVAEFIEDTDTTGLLVIKDDRIVFEEYYLGNTAASRCISWSVAKSFVSALVGIAVAEGRIDSIMDPVMKYVPELRGSGYDGVPIKHILQMSSGVRWDEHYGDFNSDINRMGRALALGKSLNEFCTTLVPELEPGTFNRYVSMDTQVLGMMLVRVTDQTLSSYLEEKIWQRIGMESDAYWLLDDAGMELAMGGLNVTLRDYARFGRLYLREGNWEGEQILPADWVHASVTPDAPHLMPGAHDLTDWPIGYGYQWWIPERPDGAFMAIGVFNEFIYVYPEEHLVIAKTSAFRRYTTEDLESELAHVDFFRAVADHLHENA